ncbi:MAG: 1-acyl-sn-glycerol-3-phosphate acyltransferase [Verrucomicrobiota bacterium]
MKDLWYRCWHGLAARIYFGRIAVRYPERLPKDGPCLYVALHRNGAVDGFVYRQAVPRAVFLISSQLRRGFLARCFFCGIAVTRRGDAGDRSENAAALRECVQLLEDGGGLVVFPEGTSSLGPRHLPFRNGAASIALEALGRQVPLRIVPLGIHYEQAWAFRSRVEVVVGEPIATPFAEDLSDSGRLREMKRRLTTALESVGANFPSAAAQEEAGRLASAAALDPSRSFCTSLKSLESGVPESLAAQGRELESRLAGCRVLRYQGVALFPQASWWQDAWRLLLAGPVVLAGGLVNLPPLLAGYLAARRRADGPNVIALWRLLAGLPLSLLWWGLVSAALLGCGHGGWLAGYAFLTIMALRLTDRTRQWAVSVWNGLICPQLTGPAREFRQSILQTLPRP